jgi:hypothetical protein
VTDPATPEQWAKLQGYNESYGDEFCAAVLELRTRVEQLEANTKQWRTDHLRLANTCASFAPDRLKFFSALLPEEDISAEGGSLVERVSAAIDGRINPDQWLHMDAARAAIRVIAGELRALCWVDAADWLDQEAAK